MTLEEAKFIAEKRNDLIRLLQFMRNNKDDEHLIDRASVELARLIDDFTIKNSPDDENDLK